MPYWLVKTEPETFSWEDFSRDNYALWDGVRNYQARNNLKAMALGDLVLFYHSVTEKCIRGVGEVTKTAFPDPTTEDKRWVAVEMKPVMPLLKKVTLAELKIHPDLSDLPLIRHSRLSVMPISPKSFRVICQLGKIDLS